MSIRIERDITERSIQAALARAAADRQDGRLPVRQADGTYAVPSSSTEGVTYTVKIYNLSQLAASCTCEHGQRPDARGMCRHAIAACAEDVRRLGGRYSIKPRKALKLMTAFAR